MLDMCYQADLNTMVPKPLSEYGWQISKNTLTIDWDSENNMAAVRKRVAGLLKGCGCKTRCETLDAKHCSVAAKGITRNVVNIVIAQIARTHSIQHKHKKMLT